ncbi:hypothetical protein Bbelb_349940 [Branchiostoma belcheri]|nr:hypothetical protein Bbelb_349940 [Branchiostoma belcheri]
MKRRRTYPKTTELRVSWRSPNRSFSECGWVEMVVVVRDDVDLSRKVANIILSEIPWSLGLGDPVIVTGEERNGYYSPTCVVCRENPPVEVVILAPKSPMFGVVHPSEKHMRCAAGLVAPIAGSQLVPLPTSEKMDLSFPINASTVAAASRTGHEHDPFFVPKFGHCDKCLLEFLPKSVCGDLNYTKSTLQPNSSTQGHKKANEGQVSNGSCLQLADESSARRAGVVKAELERKQVIRQLAASIPTGTSTSPSIWIRWERRVPKCVGLRFATCYPP